METQQDKLKIARRNELDWLRVLAFGMLIFFHIGMVYVSDWPWHIKSPHQSEWLQTVMLWSGQWRMPLLFLISGSAVAFIIRRMTLMQFYWSRHTRVLLPLIFGIAVIVVPQVYVEGRLNGMISDDVGFFRAWFAYLNQSSELFSDYKTIGNWHITWNHLWFLMYVFCYALIVWGLKCCTVLFSVVLASGRECSRESSRESGCGSGYRREDSSGEGFSGETIRAYGSSDKIYTEKVWRTLEHRVPSIVLVVVIPIILLQVYGKLLYPHFPITHAFVDDFYNHARYLSAFLFGYAVVRMPKVWESIKRIRWLTLMAAVLSFALVLTLYKGGSLGGAEYKDDVDNFVWSCNAWLWLLTVCGWGQHRFNRSNPVISYLNRGVYCYYILHQTIIIIFAYHIRDYHLGLVAEPALLILVTVVSCILGYEIIKRIPVLRVLMGVSNSPLKARSD